jgi:PAS domain S-box-containing protein
MEQISGLPAEQVLGRVAFEVFPFLRDTGEDAVFRRVIAGESVINRERPYRVPETEREGVFEGSYFPVRGPDGRVCGGMAIIRDVTERDRAARLYEEAQAVDRRKDELLAMLGHELRNPLGAIRTALQVVNHADTTPEEVARQRAIIDRQMRHVVGLVDDLLDVSRAMSGRITLEPHRLDLNEIARRCLLAAEHDERAPDHDLSLSVHAAPVPVLGDPVRLEQIVSGLLDNALKYTPAGGQIEMRIAREDGHGVIRIRDTGIGIPPDVLPRVFDVFMQADVSLARSRGGLGLGLTLVRKLTELHGGRVAAESEGAGRGSQFVVALPLAPDAAGSDDAAAATARPATPSRRVLIIEDNADARDALRALLELWGHRVETANDGPHGFELALAKRPDVVIVDIGLPGLDGYHVAQGLRAALGAGTVFLIALTGYGQPDDRRRAFEAGFDVHLVKPVAPEVLSETLARVPEAAGDRS